MPSSTQQSHARSHSLLLLQKLLNLRDSASPLTLVLDTLEQSAAPVVHEFLSRAKISKSKTIYLSSSLLRKPSCADIFIKAWGKTPDALRAEISSHYSSGSAGHLHKILVVIDGLNGIARAAGSSSNLSLFLSGLITPAVSLVAVYHADVPLPPNSSSFGSEYEPHPLTTLCHLATAVLRVASLYQAVERRRARNRSLQEPEWGLAEGREGVLVGLGSAEKRSAAGEGLVLEMELRRRSGRAVAEKFVLVPRSAAAGAQDSSKVQTSRLYLLSDHPAFRDPSDIDQGGAAGEGDGEMGTTFNLGLTEKQRRDREGIVLPYFDAQTDIGAGEGGRILYEMGREDDFDDEEDEI
ncbi:histone acetylation protein 2 [Daldinia vernicosa]|uniref:histone acetylation protein 2 n=1 Tax=Daldinia vernicosa TaxID=114800 RepID=UPI002008E984|nr:histone acetylation protein 2 [Daldinia vernicosa]KAI0848608.1 histone acetylation protein 2 [Daldinia vernicosa]